MPWRRMDDWRYSSTILNLGTRWKVSGQFEAPAALPPGNSPGIRWKGGWMGPRNVLDPKERKNCFFPCRQSNPGRPARSPLLYRLSYHSSFLLFLVRLARAQVLWAPNTSTQFVDCRRYNRRYMSMNQFEWIGSLREIFNFNFQMNFTILILLWVCAMDHLWTTEDMRNRRIRHAKDLLNVPRIIRLCKAVVVLFTHKNWGEKDNLVPLHNLLQHIKF
jgi:hypothetical protein